MTEEEIEAMCRECGRAGAEAVYKSCILAGNADAVIAEMDRILDSTLEEYRVEENLSPPEIVGLKARMVAHFQTHIHMLAATPTGNA
jgi:hypothetical protein